MFEYTKASLKKLDECDPRLKKIFMRVIEVIDCSILEGHRPKHLQDLAFANGNSKVAWPNGKHNKLPSLAVDAAPCPIDWNNRERFVFFAGVVLGIASEQGVKLRWGGDWDSDRDLKDQIFFDLPHFEIIED